MLEKYRELGEYHIESKMFEEIDCGLHYIAEHHYGGVCRQE